MEVKILKILYYVLNKIKTTYLMKSYFVFVSLAVHCVHYG